MKKQIEWWGIEYIDQLKKAFQEMHIKKVLLVCGNSFQQINKKLHIETFPIEIERFSDFSPNPDYKDVKKGIERFVESRCDAVFAVGGGSALDVAKCIKLYANDIAKFEEFETNMPDNRIPLFAIPTTAGSGSEMTKFAVLYKEGIKYSIQHESLIYDYVLYEGEWLKTLPVYQRKATVLDALSHAIESYWSINSTEESMRYAEETIYIIVRDLSLYMECTDDKQVNNNILKAASLAGKAINITKTTAGHALSYKMTGLYGIAHGHAAAICTESVWKYMILHLDHCIDVRGKEYLEKQMQKLSILFGGQRMEDGAECFAELLQRLKMYDSLELNEEEKQLIVQSVNLERLKNTPIKLEVQDLHDIVENVQKK